MQKVEDVMSKDIHFCTPKDNVYEVALKMKEHDIGAVPICLEGEVIGMITDRDIAIRGVASKHPGSTRVTEIMSSSLVTITPASSVDAAAELMAAKQIRRLPVVEGKRLVGMVSLGDIAVREVFSENASKALSEISECHGELHH